MTKLIRNRKVYLDQIDEMTCQELDTTFERMKEKYSSEKAEKKKFDASIGEGKIEEKTEKK